MTDGDRPLDGMSVEEIREIIKRAAQESYFLATDRGPEPAEERLSNTLEGLTVDLAALCGALELEDRGGLRAVWDALETLSCDERLAFAVAVVGLLDFGAFIRSGDRGEGDRG